MKLHIAISRFLLSSELDISKSRSPILRWSLLLSFSQWCPIAATRPSKWTVPIMSGFRDFQCLGSHDLENSDLPMVNIPMTTPHVETSLLAPESYLPHSFCRSDGFRWPWTKSNGSQCVRSFTTFDHSPLWTCLMFSCHLHRCHQWQAFTVCSLNLPTISPFGIDGNTCIHGFL